MSRRPRHPIAPPAPVTPQRSPWERTRLDDVAGHRVTRRLAVGTRATLLLAHPFPRGDDDGRPHILKVFHPQTSSASVDVELAALSSLTTPHIVRLVDIASVEAGQPPCLVLEKLPGPALSTYLGKHDSIGAGQAVTILAPLCSAVQALHDAGVTHGGIHVRRIVFDDAGAPVLTGFGRGVLRQPTGTLRTARTSSRVERDQALDVSQQQLWRAAVLDDQRDLLAVVDEVLAHVDPVPSSESIDTSAIAGEIGTGAPRQFLAGLERVLFSLATPEVIPGAAATPATDAAQPGSEQRQEPFDPGVVPSIASGFDWERTTPVLPSAPAENRLVAALRVLGASSSVLETASTVTETLGGLVARARARRENASGDSPSNTRVAGGHAPKRRSLRPLIVGGACAVLATTVFLFVVPTSSDEARAGSDDAARPSVPAEIRPSATDPGSQPVDETSVLLGDDPAEALRSLARKNDGCAAIVEKQACLAGVFQLDSANGAVIGDEPVTIDATDAIVTGSWGGSALVAARLNDQPASFLLVKGEAGWRVRDVFVSDQ